ncbi:GntR family transcriptional regulator [soil metagenome]
MRMAEALHPRQNLNVIPLTRDTMQDRVYRQVCDLILDGEIIPGQLVTIHGLADAFGVSAMPVREALKRLTAAKALTVVSGRSIGIPPLSQERLLDLRNVRIEVEALAGQWAAVHITQAELERLAEACHVLETANAVGDARTYLRANHAFHFSIYRAARSESLLAIIETLWLQISPYFNLLRGSGNYASANRQHQAMLDALAARDGAAVAAAMRSDIEAAYGILKKLVDS